jgi:toxin ParE1/3/4
MQVRWTSAAADDLENIANYLFEKTSENAARLIREIYNASSSLKSFPNRGRAGKKEGTREWVMPSLPYIIFYQVGAISCSSCASCTVRRTGRDNLQFAHESENLRAQKVALHFAPPDDAITTPVHQHLCRAASRIVI